MRPRPPPSRRSERLAGRAGVRSPRGRAGVHGAAQRLRNRGAERKSRSRPDAGRGVSPGRGHRSRRDSRAGRRAGGVRGVRPSRSAGTVEGPRRAVCLRRAREDVLREAKSLSRRHDRARDGLGDRGGSRALLARPGRRRRGDDARSACLGGRAVELGEADVIYRPAEPTHDGRPWIPWAILFARLVLGFIFFMAGLHKVFVLTPAGHVEKWFIPYRDTFLPVWSLWAAGLAIPFVELAGGALLLIGWRIREALLALGAVLVVVTFGPLLQEPLYSFHEHVSPRLALLVFLLVMAPDED